MLKNNYFSYTLRGRRIYRNKDVEDINLLADVDYFDHLKAMGTKWKQRTFISIGIAKQINTILNEPFILIASLVCRNSEMVMLVVPCGQQ